MNGVCDAYIYRHCEELQPLTALILNQLLCNFVAFYHCSTPLLMRNITSLKQI